MQWCKVIVTVMVKASLFSPQTEEESVAEKKPPRFQLSSLIPQERIDYTALIDELGESQSSISLCVSF